MSVADAIFKQLRKNADKVESGDSKLRGKTALIISAFAAVYSVNVFLHNQASSTVLNNTIKINDLWAFYQAKSIKQTQYEIAADAVEGKDQKRYLQYRAEVERYEDEPKEGKKALMAQARQVEKERDTAKKRVPWYGIAGSVMQIAIVLLTASMLTAGIMLFWGGIAAQTAAMVLMSQGFFLWF